MTKVKLVALVEVDGQEMARSAPRFMFGFNEDLPLHDLQAIADETTRDVAAHLQVGLRRNAAPRGIKVLPLEG